MVDECCRRIYSETKSFYEEMFGYGKDDPGFQILYGPPFRRAPVLFIGYQPGKGTKTPLEEQEDGSERGWPTKSEFVTEKWRLATNLQQMFSEEFLCNCVGTNATFIRADTMKAYKHRGQAIRDRIEAFCVNQVEKMVKAIEPRLIVAIGFGTLALFHTGGKADLKNAKGRVLAKKGSIAGRNVVGVLHLSGAQISNVDRQSIARKIVELSAGNFSQTPEALL